MKRSQVTIASIIFFCFVGEVRLEDGDNTGCGGWGGGGGISAERPALDAAKWKLRGNLAVFLFLLFKCHKANNSCRCTWNCCHFLSNPIEPILTSPAKS